MPARVSCGVFCGASRDMSCGSVRAGGFAEPVSQPHAVQPHYSSNMKAKFEFTPEALDADKLAHIKAGDVLLVAPQPQEASAAQGPADTQPQSEKAQPVLGCYLLSAPEEQVGVVPASAAKHLAQYPQLQASVRSVKRSADGAVQQLLVRVEIGPQGPVAYSELRSLKHAARHHESCAAVARRRLDTQAGFHRLCAVPRRQGITGRQ